MTSKTPNHIKLFSNIKKRIRLRTYIALGLIFILTPLAFAAAYGILGALGGGSATPIAHWAMDEGADDTCTGGSNDACDSSANAFDLAKNGNVSWQTEDKCISGKCTYYDGDSDYLGGGDQSAFDFGEDEDFSISLWFKANAVSDSYYLVSKGALEASDGAENSGYFVRITNSTIILSLRDQTSTARTNIVTGSVINANNWYHLTATFDRDGNGNIYLNGNSIASGSISDRNGDLGNAQPFVVGTYSASTSFREFLGFIDEVKVFDSALTAAQVKAEFAGGAAVLGSQNTDFLNDGLVGYWPMDDNVSGNGQNIADRSGGGNTATTNDGANDTGMDCTNTGRFGGGCEFDGTDDYIQDSPADSIVVGEGESLTVSTWFKADTLDSTFRHLVNNGWSTTEGFFLRINNSNRIDGKIEDTDGDVNCNDASGIIGVTTLSTGTWYMATFTWNAASGESKLYLNGNLEGSCKDSDINNTAYSNLLTFGTHNVNGAYFDGTLDDVRIYNRAFSPAEVQSLYNWAPGPVGYWNFDEGAGTTVYDHSGTGTNATIADGGTVGSWTQGKFGGAYDLRGADHDGVDLMELSSPLDLGTNNTISFWVNFNNIDDDGATIATSDDISGEAQGYMVYFDNADNIYSRQNTDAEVSVDTGDISFNTWYHFSIARSGTTVTFYMNGSQVGSPQTLEDNNPFSLYSLTNYPSGELRNYALDGKLDEIKVYNYARTAQQVIEDMNGGHPTGGSPVASQVSYFSFDEQHGEIINNRGFIGSASVGTKGGSSSTGESDDPTWKTQSNCKINGCLSFDGGDYVDLSGDSNYQIANKTITFWANPGTFGTTTPVISTGGANWYAGFASANQMFTSHATGAGSQQTTSSGANAYVSNQWTHFAYSFTVSGDNVTIKMYVNGREIRSTSYTTGYGSFYGSSLVIGAFNSSSFFYTGNLDELKFYNSVLTPEQIKIDMNQGAINFGGGVDGSADTFSGAVTPPVAHWDFNEKVSGDDETVADKSGNGNDGTTVDGDNNTGINCSIPGRYGSACEFDGDDSISIGDVSEAEVGTGDFTLSAWVKHADPSSASANAIIGKRPTGGAGSVNGYTLQIHSGAIRFAMDNDDGGFILSSAGSLSANTWHHVAVTVDRDNSSGVVFYLDGKIVGTADPTGVENSLDNTSGLGIGINSVSGTGNFTGLIDEPKIFDYSLTQSQISYEFNQGAPVVWLKFDECTDDTLNNSGYGGSTLNATITIGSSGDNTSAGDCSSGTSTEAWNNGTTGKFNGSLDFDGTDDYATITDNDAIDFGTGEMSVSAWVKLTNAGASGVWIVDKKTAGSNAAGYGLNVTAAGNPTFRIANGSAQAPASLGPVVNDGSWHHLVGVVERGTPNRVVLYVDGKLRTSGNPASDGWDIDSNLNLEIGRRNTANDVSFDGQIDDLRVYNYALSADQVKNVMNEGRAVRF